jgi:aryl-alcohol dehydrogenase-like predicted oxidoreductase
MLAVCAELNLASINRSPLAMGLVTGKFLGRYISGNSQDNSEVTERIRDGLLN